MKKAPLESEIANTRLEYDSSGIPRKHKPELKISVNICAIKRWWKKWKSRKKEPEIYKWVYECGCVAKSGASSDPYCSIHGMRLLRYKQKT